MKPLQKIGPGLRLAIVAGTSAGIAVSVMLLSAGRNVQVVESASAEATTTTSPTATTTTTAADLDQRVTAVEGQVNQVEERVTVVERQVATATTIPPATTTSTAPAPTTTTTTLPDGQVTSIAVERLWDEPRRQQTGEVDIQVTLAVDAPIYHAVSVLVRVTSIWTAGPQPTETHTDMVVRFPAGITATATKVTTTVAQVDRVDPAGWRIELGQPGPPEWQPVP